MSKLRKLIYCDGTDWEYIDFFQEYMGFEVRTEDPGPCDFVLFTGGVDVNPRYYHEPRHPTTSTSRERDESDLDRLRIAALEGKHCIGICRGAQFLHVMNGGTLWQDVNNHRDIHGLGYKGTNFEVTSTHHQMMRIDRPIKGCEILATARIPNQWGEHVNFEGQVQRVHHPPQLEIVTHTQPDDGAVHLCFQPHPEYFMLNDGEEEFEDTETLFNLVLNDIYFSN